MIRRVVQVAKIRIMDAEIGDVVNRDPKERKGWFTVASREVLFNGDLQLSDISTHITIAAAPLDVIGVQFVQAVEIPDQYVQGNQSTQAQAGDGEAVPATASESAPVVESAPAEDAAVPAALT